MSGNSLVLALLLTACSSSNGGRDRKADTSPPGASDDTDGPDLTGETGSPTPTGDSGGPPGGGVLTLGPPVICDDPEQRVNGYYGQPSWIHNNKPPEVMYEGSGLVIADFDGDGVYDLFLAGTPPQLYFADADGSTFVERKGALDAIDLSAAVGGSAADYDGDGDFDLVVVRFWERNRLLQNDGKGNFTDVTDEAGLLDLAYVTMTSSWADTDLDGDLDLFLGNYGPQPKDVNDHPPGHPSEFYKNNGDGTFSDGAAELPAEVHEAYSFMSAFFDIDGDHRPELFSVHDFGKVRPSRMVRNLAQGWVVDDSALFHANFDGMGFGAADINGDQIPDFIQTSVKNISLLQSLTPFKGSETDVIWVEVSEAQGMEITPGTGTWLGQDWGWGCELADLDNDGDIDAAGGYGIIDIYFGNPREADQIWEWDQNAETWLEVGPTRKWNISDKGSTRGLITADINNDGWLDIVRNFVDKAARIDRQRCGAEAWLVVRVRDDRALNLHGIGTRVVAEVGDTVHTRWIVAGATGMFSGNPPEAHFGLGTADAIDRLEITWPDGERDVFEDVETRRIAVVDRAP